MSLTVCQVAYGSTSASAFAMPLLSSQCTTSFSHPCSTQPPPLILSRPCQLSRHGSLMSAGNSNWLSRHLPLCHRRLSSSQHPAASCPLTPPLLFASCSPAGCGIATGVALPPPLVACISIVMGKCAAGAPIGDEQPHWCGMRKCDETGGRDIGMRPVGGGEEGVGKRVLVHHLLYH